MSFEYKISCEEDSGWYIQRKRDDIKGTTEYLHANFNWYELFDAPGSTYGGLWPTRESALVVWAGTGINEPLVDNYHRPSQIIYADEHTVNSANFKGTTKRDEYASGKYFIARESSVRDSSIASIEYFRREPTAHWNKYADDSSYSTTQIHLLRMFRQFQPTVEIKGDVYDKSLDTAISAKEKGTTNMCQGVIGLYNSFNGHYHWGVGSHTALIEKIWPKSTNTAGDKLVRFEANLKNGPGEFTVEGATADQFLKDEIKNKLMNNVGTVDLLLAYIEKHGNWDDAFFNIFHNYYDFYDKIYAKSKERADIATQISNVTNGVNNLNSVVIEVAFRPLRDESAKKHDEAKNAYFKKLAATLRQAAFSTHTEYTAFHTKTIGKVDLDLRVIADIMRLELEAETARVRCEVTKNHYAQQENKDEVLAKLRADNAKLVAGLMRDYIDKNPDQLRPAWKATLKKA